MACSTWEYTCSERSVTSILECESGNGRAPFYQSVALSRSSGTCEALRCGYVTRLPSGPRSSTVRHCQRKGSVHYCCTGIRQPGGKESISLVLRAVSRSHLQAFCLKVVCFLTSGRFAAGAAGWQQTVIRYPHSYIFADNIGLISAACAV